MDYCRHIVLLILATGYSACVIGQTERAGNEYIAYAGLYTGTVKNTAETSLSTQTLPAWGMIYRRELAGIDSVSHYFQTGIAAFFVRGFSVDRFNRSVVYTESYYNVPVMYMRKRKINPFMELNSGAGIYYSVLNKQHNKYISPIEASSEVEFGELMKMGLIADISMQFLYEKKAVSIVSGLRVEGDAFTIKKHKDARRQYLLYGLYLGFGKKF